MDLQSEHSGNLVFSSDGFIETCLQAVLVSDAENGDLIVVARSALKIGERIKVQQRQGLGADLAECEAIAGNRRSGCGIDNLDGLTLRVQYLREISAAFGCVGHEAGSDAGIAIPGPLVVDEEVGAVAEQARNLDRTAEGEHALDMVVVGPRRVLSGQRKWPGIEGRVIEDETEVAVIQDRESFRLLPKACAIAKGELAALLAVPLMRKPSAARWLSSDGF